MRAEVALGQTAAVAPTLERRERPLWQAALAAWLGQRLLIGALVVAWQLLLLIFSPAAFYRVWTLFDGIFYTLIAQYGYRILQEAAYFPLYPLLMRVTAPLTADLRQMWEFFGFAGDAADPFAGLEVAA